MGSNNALFVNQKALPDQGNIGFISTDPFFSRMLSVLMLPPNMPLPVCVRVNVDACNNLDFSKWGIRMIQ